MNDLQTVQAPQGDEEIKIYMGSPTGGSYYGKHAHTESRASYRTATRSHFRGSPRRALDYILAPIIDLLSTDAARWWLRLAAKYLLIILAFVVYTAIISNNAARHARAEQKAADALELQAYIQEQQEAAEAERLAAANKERNEAELVAQVLYGVKDNSTADLRTLAWCIFNRVDNARFPNTIEAVVNQESQWMGYRSDNPVLEDLYQIAVDEMEHWRDGAHRPVSDDYVYMSWSPSSITLRDNYTESGSTHYWRYK